LLCWSSNKSPWGSLSCRSGRWILVAGAEKERRDDKDDLDIRRFDINDHDDHESDDDNL